MNKYQRESQLPRRNNFHIRRLLLDRGKRRKGQGRWTKASQIGKNLQLIKSRRACGIRKREKRGLFWKRTSGKGVQPPRSTCSLHQRILKYILVNIVGREVPDKGREEMAKNEG